MATTGHNCHHQKDGHDDYPIEHRNHDRGHRHLPPVVGNERGSVEEAYDVRREAWLTEYETAAGFDEWFTEVFWASLAPKVAA